MNIYMTFVSFPVHLARCSIVQSVRLYSSMCPGESSEARRVSKMGRFDSPETFKTSGRSVKIRVLYDGSCRNTYSKTTKNP